MVANLIVAQNVSMIKEIGVENFWAKLYVQNVVVSCVMIETNPGQVQAYKEKEYGRLY